MIRKQCHANVLLQELRTKEDKVHFEVQDQVEFSETNRRLANMINKMPPMRKKVFELSRLEGKSHKEIADILFISTKTVEKHISQALKQIRSGLGWVIIIWQTIIFYLK